LSIAENTAENMLCLLGQ